MLAHEVDNIARLVSFLILLHSSMKINMRPRIETTLSLIKPTPNLLIAVKRNETLQAGVQEFENKPTHHHLRITILALLVCTNRYHAVK